MKSNIAGILSIISGAFGILGGLLMFLIIPLTVTVMNTAETTYYSTSDITSFITGFYAFLGTIGLILGILSVVGGTFALKKKLWGMALTGAIASILTFFPCGIAAIILVSLGKNEFTRPASPVTSGQSGPQPLSPPAPPTQSGSNQPPATPSV